METGYLTRVQENQTSLTGFTLRVDKDLLVTQNILIDHKTEGICTGHDVATAGKVAEIDIVLVLGVQHVGVELDLIIRHSRESRAQ